MNNQLKDSYQDLYKVGGITLSVFSAEDVRSQSVCEITEEQIYKENGDPVTAGINDDRMGTMDKDRICKTCMGTQVDCPGHFGMIQLAKPVYHGNLIDYVQKVLRCVCFHCSYLLADDINNKEIQEELQHYRQIKNEKSRFNKVFKLASNLKLCPNCQSINHKYRRGTLKIEYEIRDSKAGRPDSDSKQVLWPETAQAILKNISETHMQALGLNKEKSNPSNMIIDNLAIAPPPVRPSVAMGGSASRSEDDLTFAYRQVIKQNNEIKRSISFGHNDSMIRDQRKVLQFYVATVMDNDIQGAGTQRHKSGQPIKAIRARLKGKEGRLRGNLMGKRVDFSARSVITPDPNLRLDQLGVPIEIAMNMTIPEVVTEHNMAHMRQLVDRGANTWPGAKYIRRTDGRCIDLSMLGLRTDQHLEIGYLVERHLNNDDYVIFNRQPSLHKMSMMGHRIRVLPFQTFRLNLSVTTPYNADFDGDEMNMHVPQSMETKAEIKEIMAVPKQVVAPQGNKPCMGIVQDALLGIMRLTLRDTFVDKPLLMNLLMFIDYDYENGLPLPAIIKPKPLWTGKQVISLIIPQAINFENSSNYDNIKDDGVVIQQGEHLSGILNKKSVGNTAGGIIHLTWKDLGPTACCDLLSNIQLVVNNWLVNAGFTVGVSDIIPKPVICDQVFQTIQTHSKCVHTIIKKTQEGSLECQPGKSLMESFEHEVNTELNNARNNAGNIVLEALSSDNRLKNMVNAGSKGSNMNISQIMACVGQQNVEGKRIPFGFQRRSLPHFPKDDYGPESKGFVANSYLIGLTPTEFYFHAMGGREGLIDTAVKTADTGYISRRLMKALEDVMVKYDGTVRTSKELIVQFLYGEDGMAGEMFESVPLSLPKLDNKKMSEKYEMLYNINESQHRKKMVQVMGPGLVQRLTEDADVRDLFQKEYEQVKADRALLRSMIMKDKVLDSCYCPLNIPRIITNVKQLNDITVNSMTDIDPEHMFKSINGLLDSLCVMPEARRQCNLDDSGIVREAHQNSTMYFKIFLRTYLNSKKLIMEDRLDTTAFDQLITMIREKFLSAIVHAGEMVGSIGAQSMGEPATQMTLNTFHNAGISSKNVTLGVPRLKEVINVAKTIKTPSLKIFPARELAKDQQGVMRIGDKIQHMTLFDLVSDWGIYFDPNPEDTILAADKELINHQVESNMIDGIDMRDEFMTKKMSRWVLRFKMRSDHIFNEDFRFMRDVAKKIDVDLNGQEQQMDFIYSEDTAEEKVIRIRPFNMNPDDDKMTITNALRELAGEIMHNITLRGYPEISKVSYTNSSKDTETFSYHQQTGAYSEEKSNWLIETDGCALQKVFSIEEVDATRTASNNVIEIFQVLGIEAARMKLIQELRLVLGTYDIYVNYRHISILVDVMTQRGILTAITRHGINRVDSGPLRKCSFEETAEILLEAAFFGEHDPLTGITENIIFGQLAHYGTGSFDLIVDRKQLMSCVDVNVAVNQPATDSPYNDGRDRDRQTGTPIINQLTPDPHQMDRRGQGYDQAGGNSSYHGGDVGQFTPGNGQTGMISPQITPNNYPNGGASTYHNQFDAPNMGYMGPMGAQTPHYNQQQAYTSNTPRYHDQMGGGVSAVYKQSPGYNNYGGASQHQQYSPLHAQNPFNMSAYSPNTPNYNPAQPSMNAVRQHTPTYQAGLSASPGQPGFQAYQMPVMQSPSTNPALAPQGTNASPMHSVGSGGASGYAASPAGAMGYGGPTTYVPSGTPQYQATGSPAHLAAGQIGQNIPAGGGQAYDPNAKNDSSDSDAEPQAP